MVSMVAGRVIRTGPVSMFGSGMDKVPSVPVTSNMIRLRGESKLNTLCETAPPAKFATMPTWV